VKKQKNSISENLSKLKKQQKKKLKKQIVRIYLSAISIGTEFFSTMPPPIT